jgi:CHAD domain-containing protein
MATSLEPHLVSPPNGNSLATALAGLSDETTLRRLVFGQLEAAGQAAIAAAADIEKRGPRAVHDYRKALRRARAMLALLSEALPGAASRTARRTIRDARRALGDARDHAVATTTIDKLELGEVERDAARAVVGAAQATQPAAELIAQAVRDGAARVVSEVEAIDAVLAPSLTQAELLAGVTGVYRKARRAWRGAKRSRRAFHAWRRRSKELAHQLDLVARQAGPRVDELRHQFETVSDGQGPVVDLIALRAYIRRHGEAVSEEARTRLAGAIKLQLADVMPDARRAGRDAFRRKPAKFTRSLAKAIRRDLDPTVALPSA